MGLRSELTYLKARFVLWVDAQGWKGLEDFSRRTEYEQAHLFLLHLSDCDGVKRVSPHQYEASPHKLAFDMYIDDGTGDIENEEVYKKAHEQWEEMGGDPVTILSNGGHDWGHWQVRER